MRHILSEIIKGEKLSSRISDDKLAEAFEEASRQLLEGKLPTTKKLIELMVDKVLVYKNSVKVIFNYHPELQR